ncbi:N-alpha-acetyltransferase 35 NatC auxiliary subunit [Chytriomyces hyalinus]|nr:N-alpha-acetyltransferase 35 NatC auxiliary subunit [Chytriomyces hyalinus]
MQKREWVNIDAVVTAAAEQMEPSQMIKLDTFTLWDAMAALQIMEPRMDNGMRSLPTGETKWTVSQAKSIPSFSVDEMIGISDGLVVKLLSWLSGSHLSQTLFSCVLLHDVHACKSNLLRAVLLAFLKIANKLKTLIERARIAEDDEFFGVLPFGLSLADEVADAEAVEGLQSIEDFVGNELKVIRTRSDASPQDDSAAPLFEKLIFPESCAADSEKLALIDALMARVRLLRSYLSALSYVTRRNLGSAKKSLNQALAQIELGKASVGLGKEMRVAFDVTVNRKLLHDSAPRAIAECPTHEAAYADLQTMITEMLEVVSLPSMGFGWDDTLTFVSQMGMRKVQPSVIARTILYLNLTHSGKLFGKTTYALALTQSIITAYPSCAFLFTSADCVVKKYLTEFTNLVAGGIDEPQRQQEGSILERVLLVVCGFNRALARRNLAKLGRELETIQAATEAIDGALHEYLVTKGLFRGPPQVEEPYYLSSWIYELKFHILETYLHMGFELNLFSEFEYPTVLWYMDHVYEMHLGHLNRMSVVCAGDTVPVLELLWQFQQQRDLGGGTPAIHSSSGGKKKSGHSNVKVLSMEGFAAKVASAVKSRDLSEAMLVVRQLIGRGLMLFSFGARKAGFLQIPSFSAYSPEIAYNHRFKLFMSMGSPSVQPFSDFQTSEAAFMQLTAWELVERAIMFFAEAQTLIEFVTLLKARCVVGFESIASGTGASSAAGATSSSGKDEEEELRCLLDSCRVNLAVLSKLLATAKTADAAMDWKAALPVASDKRERVFIVSQRWAITIHSHESIQR